MASCRCTYRLLIFSRSPKNAFFLSSVATTTTTTTTTTSAIYSTATETATATAATNTATATYSRPSSRAAMLLEIVKNWKQKLESSSRTEYEPGYVSLLRCFAGDEDISDVELIIERQKKDKERMAIERFGALLVGLYGRAGMFSHAYKLFDELPEFNSPRTVISFNALLGACVDCKEFDKLEELLQEVPEKLGIQPDIISYNTVVEGLCDATDHDFASRVMEKMEESLVLPDVLSYNAVFYNYDKVNKMAAAEKLWRRMEEQGVVAGVWTYSLMISCMLKNDKIEEAIELVEKMMHEKLKPDRDTYKAVIEGCAKKGKWEEAKMLYGKMVADGYVNAKMMADGYYSDGKFYGMLFSCAINNKDSVKEAIELVESTVNEKLKLDKYMYQALIEGCARTGKWEEAKMLFRKMVADGCYVTDEDFYMWLISVACDDNNNDTKFGWYVYSYSLKVRGWVDAWNDMMDWKGNSAGINLSTHGKVAPSSVDGKRVTCVPSRENGCSKSPFYRWIEHMSNSVD